MEVWKESLAHKHEVLIVFVGSAVWIVWKEAIISDRE